MKIRPFNPVYDYGTVAAWWTAHKWPVLPKIALPPTGFVVVDADDKMFCAGWLYKTDSPISALEWIVADPLATPEERDSALDVLIEALIAKAHEFKKPMIFTSVVHPKLLDRLLKHGFIVTDSQVLNLMRMGS